MRFVLILLSIVAMLGACRTKPVTADPTKPAPLTGYPLTLGAAPFLTGGYNRGAVFSLDGLKIFFLSRGRRDHRNTQVYEYDLITKAERRITFQDGDVFGVAAAQDGSIYYSSNTDEIKEAPFAREPDFRFPRADIYHSDLFGEQIDRLTTAQGFDGEMIYVPSRKQVLFTSTRTGTAGLYWLEPLTAFQVAKKIQRTAAVSTDGKILYWIEEDAEEKTQNLLQSTVLGKNRTVIRSLPGVVKSLTVNTTGKVAYAWQPKGADFVQIDLYNPETKCNRVLLKSTMDFSEPQFSPKSENVLLFRGSLKENSVVYRWELPETIISDPSCNPLKP